MVSDQGGDIIVLGAGPAGVATALGLNKLGYKVVVDFSARSYRACEGMSERAVAGLRYAGCQRAAASLPEPTARYVCWNGLANSANQERLALRENLDRSLLEDLGNAGLKLVRGRVARLDQQENSSYSVSIIQCGGEPLRLSAGFIVDARGRSAPGGGRDRIRGPETVSLLQRWQGPPVAAQSMAVSFESGWAWLARKADGQRFTQITVAADASDFPKKSALRDFYIKHLNTIPQVAEFHQDAKPVGELVARSSTSVLHLNPAQSRLIRVGDAALATDPLSGSGIFNALSTALIAPSVINTILQSPNRSALAMEFYNNRVHHTFQRFARIGRDFYAMEQRWPNNPFWQTRAKWPDLEPAHSDLAPAIVGIEQKPVVDNHQIREREVVVTSDHPLGIWHIDGIELAPIVRQLRKALYQQGIEWQSQLPSEVKADQGKLAALSAWLVKYGVVLAVTN